MSLETISRHSKNKEVFGFSQHGFMKEKCLIDWMVFYSEITCFVAEGRAVDVAFCSLLARLLTLSPVKSSAVKYGLGRWMMR